LNFYSATRDAHETYISLGQNTTFNMLYELQQYVSSMVFSQIQPPRLLWTPNFSSVMISGECLNLDKFRRGIQEVFAEVEVLFRGIRGNQALVTKLPATFTDNLPNDRRNYSFLDHGPFTEHPHQLLIHLLGDKNQRYVSLVDQGLSWNIPALKLFLTKTGEINNLLSFLCFILPTMSTRITQFVDNKHRNDQRPRNLHMLGQEMFNLLRYHKMTNATGRDECIPAFYPPRLRDVMLEYLGGIREVEEIFSRIVYGDEAANFYHKYVFCF
jgi:hypothetical protein